MEAGTIRQVLVLFKRQNEANAGMNDNSSIENIRGLSTAQAARYLGISESFLEKARINQTELPGPIAIKIGRRVIYRKNDLDAYLDNPPAPHPSTNQSPGSAYSGTRLRGGSDT